MLQALDNKDGSFCVFPDGGDQTLCLRRWVEVTDDARVASIAEFSGQGIEMCDDCREVLEAEQERHEAGTNEWRLEAL